MIKTMRVLPLLLALFAGTALAGEEQNVTADCTPGISYWSLLGAVGIDYGSGHLRLDRMYALCLPQPAPPSESNFAYSPDSGGKLATLLKGTDGATLATYVWSAENISGLWEMSEYKVLGGEQSLKPLAAGKYTLEFQLEGTPFYRFPFAVETLPSDDPYQPPGTRYFVDGAWSEYGNVFYQRNDPQSSLRFSVWVQDKAGHAQQKSLPYSAELLRLRDGNVIARDAGELRADQHWRQLDLLFHGDDANAYLKAATVLGEDGAYRVRFAVGGTTQGEYEFRVAAGRIQLQGRQLERTPAVERIVDYLYGGRYRSWWIPRTGAAAQIAN